MFVVACSVTPQNALLKNAGGSNTYHYRALKSVSPSNQLLVLVAMSGGGKRSAAFSYGVLKALRDTSVRIDGRKVRMLDEVDFIQAVSGGSFTAAFYGLERDKIFDGRYEAFLKENTERQVLARVLAPWNLLSFFGLGEGTNAAMARYWDRRLFGGRTFRDLAAQGRPVINIQATDASHGTVFVFNQLYFDLICSDLMTFPIAQAVAASNGFPGLFSPITLVNRSSKCHRSRPRWIRDALRKPDQTSRQYHFIKSLSVYLDDRKNKYVHLIDGGVVDALALRGGINSISLTGSGRKSKNQGAFNNIRHYVVIVANAQSKPDRGWGRSKTFPGVVKLLSAASGAQIDSYNFETIAVARRASEWVAKALTGLRCKGRKGCPPTKLHFVLLTFENLRDRRLRRIFNNMRTALTLKNKDADRLIKAGYDLTRANPALRRLLKDLGGSIAPAID